MAELKLLGMRLAFDEVLANGVKRQHPPQQIIGDLLTSEIAEKHARSIRYQVGAAELPLAKELADFDFTGGPINEGLVRELAVGTFLNQQRNTVLVDAVQGRPGTPTALVAARGMGAPPPAPPLPPAPAWTAPPPLTGGEKADLSRRASRLHSPNFDPCEVREPPAVFPLDATHALGLQRCYMAAYQGSSVVAVLPRSGGPDRPVKLSLPGVPGGATDGPDMVDPSSTRPREPCRRCPGAGASPTAGRARAGCGAAARSGLRR